MAFIYTMLLCAVAAIIVACAALYAANKKLGNYVLAISRRLDSLESGVKKPEELFATPAEKLERAVAEGMSSIFSYTVETARQEGINDADE